MTQSPICVAKSGCLGVQTVIPVEFAKDVSLDTILGENNRVLIHELKLLVAGRRQNGVIYFWGESGCGKTHLLQGCSEMARSLSRRAQYINLEQCRAGTLSEQVSVDCDLTFLDGLCARTLNDEQTLFSLYEQIKSQQGGLAMAGDCPPAALGIKLKDLESRLAAGGVYAVQSMNDDEKRTAIMQRAHGRGFELSAPVADFILSHCGRDEKTLFGLLDRLDHESLKSQRKITLPFLQAVLQAQI